MRNPRSQSQGDEEDFYHANNDQDQDQDYLDNDDDGEDDQIDDDIIDEEVQLELHKNAIDRAGSFDSESASNASPMLTQKKIRSMRHAATLAVDGQEHHSQTFESENKEKPARGSSHPLGNSHTSKIVTTKKTKLMAVQDPVH
jgi:hypothetical protein